LVEKKSIKIMSYQILPVLTDQTYRKRDDKLAGRIDRAYFGQDWKGILSDPQAN
jgi:hypothetical protein